jgi:hypothetical protein
VNAESVIRGRALIGLVVIAAIAGALLKRNS